MPRKSNFAAMTRKVSVHYFVNTAFGVVQIHFSGSDTTHGVFVNNKTLFDLALAGMHSIPSKDRIWDGTQKTWNIHADVWATLMPYYSVAPEIYNMIPYSSQSLWKQFLTGKVTASDSTGAKTDAQAAQDFFGSASFNNAVYHTASKTSEREDFITLLGLTSWSEFDRMDAASAKKRYRLAAFSLHPDRNNNDSSKMSRLNELWGIYGSR